MFSDNSIFISLNVPVVCDVFLRPIGKMRKHFYGRKKMCWSEAWEWRSHDLGNTKRWL